MSLMKTLGRYFISRETQFTMDMQHFLNDYWLSHFTQHKVGNRASLEFTQRLVVRENKKLLLNLTL